MRSSLISEQGCAWPESAGNSPNGSEGDLCRLSAASPYSDFHIHDSIKHSGKR